MTNINDISGQTDFLNTMSLILMIFSIAFLVAAIVLWFVFKIPHCFKVLTGIGAGKSISKLEEGAKRGEASYYVNTDVKAALSWNTSAKLNRYTSDGNDETQLLDEETVVLFDETVVLDSSDGFEINEDIMMTGANNK